MAVEDQRADNVRRMRAGMGSALLRVGTGIRRMSPYGLVALLSAGAFAPVLVAVGGPAAAVAAIGLVGSVGANVLTNVLSGAIDHLRHSKGGREPTQGEIEQELMTRIEAALFTRNAESESLRAELARALREIGMSQTALEAVVENGNQELLSAITESFKELSEHFVEFGFWLTDVRNAIADIQETQRRQDIEHQSDRQRSRRISAQLELLADQVTAIERNTRLYGIVISTGSEQETAAAVSFEERYRRGIRELLDRVELFGVDLQGVPHSYRLGAAYVSLLLEEGGSRSRSSNRLYLEEMLGTNQRILVEGAAGTGKSTVLRYLALRVLDGGLPGFGLVRGNSALIPFLLKLRSLIKDDQLRMPRPDDLIAQVAPLLNGQKPKDWEAGLLDGGRAIVLIDGIDEIRESHRPGVINWLRESIAWYPKAFYLVTSRPAAIHEKMREDLRDLGFATAKLEPMTGIQVDDFIDRWYRAAAGSDRYRQYGETADIEALARRLRDDLGSRSDLQSLATTPLLCAVICAVNLHWWHLPARRTELYDSALQLLLERRDVQRSIRGSEQLRAHESQLMLARIAFRMLMNDEDSISRPSALNAIAELAEHSGYSADYMLQQLMEQTGLLQEASADLVEFRYSSFQDYLAAGEIIRQNLFRYLIINSHNPTYHDVVVNVTELVDLPAKRQLLAALMTRAEKETEASLRRQLWSLAADCLNGIEGVDDLAARIRNELRLSAAEGEIDLN
jgi:hypothetical protein